MTRAEAIHVIQSNRQTSGYTMLCEALDMAIDALREQEQRYNPKPLTLEELRQMPPKEWVWVEVLQKRSGLQDESAYYRKFLGWMPENIFFCGYTGWATAFDYADYGKTWFAYRSKPKEDT